MIYIIAFLMGQSALADIVFFDYNNGPLEIAAAERAARKRGERVHVFPVVSAPDRAQLRELQDQMRSLERQVISMPSSNPERRELERRYHALDSRRVAISSRVRFGMEEARAALRQLQGRGVKVSSLILSGHDGNGNFSGTQGGMHSADLKTVLKEFPDLSAGIKSLFLAGCYTATPGSLEYSWQDAMPNLQAVAGYPGSAPAVDKLAGHQFLERFLSGENRLAAARGPAEVKKIAGGMIPPHVSTTAAICLPNKKYFHQGSYRDLADEWKQCEPLMETLTKNRDTYLCYMEAKPGCEEPPADGQTGPLRDYYRALQAFQPCRHNPQFASRLDQLFDGETMIRLIYFKNVRKNFADQHRSSLAETERLLTTAGVPDDLAKKITKLKDMSRREILDYIQQLEEFHLSRRRDDRDIGESDQTLALHAMGSVTDTLKRHLAGLDPRCVPFHWVEAGSNDRSACDPAQHLGDKAIEHSRAQIPIHRLNAKYARLSAESSTNVGGIDGQDEVTSDEAVRATIISGQSELHQARMDAVRYEAQILQMEQDLRRLGSAPSDQRRAQEYRSTIQEYRERMVRAQETARRLGDPIDTRALQENRREFFTTALRFARADRTTSDAIQAHEQEVARSRDELTRTADPHLIRRIEDQIQMFEQHLRRMREAQARRDQHREYLERMERIHTTGPSAEDQTRVAELVRERVQILMREEREALDHSITHYQAMIRDCNARPDDHYCRSVAQQIPNSLSRATTRLLHLQRQAELNDFHM